MTVNWRFLCASIAFGGAAWVASTGHDGWGWLIVMGFLAMCSSL